ncbi:MAG: PEP-CTERM sorting domain-containing protein [Burkholderiaceae bacterium]
MIRRFAEGLRRRGAFLSFLAALACAAPVQAAYYTGDWDPGFGPAFPELGWRGEATFFVPDACLAKTGWVFNFAGCSSFGMQLVSAEVDFYKLSDPSNPAFQETLSFGTASDAVLKMKIVDGALAGVIGTFDYFLSSTLPIAGAPYTDFVLFFEGDYARMLYVSKPDDGWPSIGLSSLNPVSGGSSFITFRPLPEPGSLALVGLGLALVGWAGRRRTYPAR